MYSLFSSRTDELLKILKDAEGLEPKYQRLIAEVAVIHLSYLMDNILEAIFTRLLAGADYLDGTSPKLLTPASSITHALKLLLAQGRRNPKIFLSWADGSTCNDMIKYTFDSTDPCYSALIAHGGTIKELKEVRNYAAHRSASALEKYRLVLQGHRGAAVNAIPVGQYLTTRRISRRLPNPILWYVRAIQIFVKELARAP